MQARHRIPTIFNLSMVDVLCCALGCVILLWLVYFKEARERSVAAGQTKGQLAAAKQKLDGVLVDLASTQQDLTTGKQHNHYLTGKLVELTTQRDQVLAKLEKADNDHQAAMVKLTDALAAIARLQKDAKILEAQDAATKALLAQKVKEYGDLATKYLGAAESIKALDAKINDQKNALALSAAQAAELKLKLTELDSKINEQKSMLALNANQAAELKLKLANSEKNASLLEQQLAASKALSKEYGSQLANVEKKAMKLEGELDKRKLEQMDLSKRYEDMLALKLLLEQNLAAVTLDLSKSGRELVATKDSLAKSDQALAITKNDMARLEALLSASKLANQGLANQTTVLSSQIDKLRAAADNRFAGIEMGGSRVLFLVDMSGSMRMKDYYIEDPDKWPLVCAILGKLIQSIPDLKYFQVILFSDKIRYPLANAGKWHEYQGPETIKNVVDAVRSEVPENETNMSAVFEEAFKYRALGLDTIYMLSDGLPNAGDGLPKGAEKLTETERGTILGKYIRDKMKSTWNVPYGRWTQQRVRINAVGFYFDSPDVGAFLWALARDNDGGFVGLSKP